MTTPRLEQVDSFEAALDDWRRLSRSSVNVFSTPEWAQVWWEHLGRDRPLLIWTVRSASEVLGIVPLYVQQRVPLRVARIVGHGQADELGPLCAPANANVVGGAVPEILERSGARLFDCRSTPEQCELGEECSAAPCFGATRRREFAGRADGATSCAREARISGSRCDAANGASTSATRCASGSRTGESLARDLDFLFSSHRAVRARTDFGPERFHRDFSAVALERGWLRLWILELDGRRAAAWYGFRFGEVETYYQAGRDPLFDELSVGFVLLAHSIRSALDDNVTEYRFGRGDEPYKYRFATEDCRVETVLVARGAALSGASRVLARGKGVARRARGTVRRLH